MTVDTQTEAKAARRGECPSCGIKGKRVSTVTLGALLKDEFAKRFTAERPKCDASTVEGCKPIAANTGWRFCASMNCDVVYFSEEDATTFTKSQLKVPVGVKEQAGDRPLCYCFGHSVASIKDELRTKGRSDALEDIRAKMKDPGCRCETENPSGSCCLGSVARGIKIAEEELNVHGADAQDATGPAAGGAVSVRVAKGQVRDKGAFVAMLGAVVTVIAGSACCWLPLLLIAFGFSAAGIGSFFEQYRPYLLTATFALLGAAWYFAYRAEIRRAWVRLRGKPTAAVEACCAPQTTRTAAHSCCEVEQEPEPEACCATGVRSGTGKATWRRFAMRQFNQVMLWMATILIVLFAMFPHSIGLLLGSRSNLAAIIDPDDQRQMVLQIDGMTCESCASIAENALRSVPGVLAATVSYEKKQAVVVVPKAQEVPRAALLRAVRQAGYEAHFVEEVAQRQIIYRLDLRELTCEGCARVIEQALRSVPGVSQVDVSYDRSEAVVKTWPRSVLRPEALIRAVRDAGYSATLKK